MANRFIESFASFATAALGARGWATANGTPTVGTDFPRAGTQCLIMTAGASVRRAFDQQATWTVGFYIYIVAYPTAADGSTTVIGFEDNTVPGDQCGLRISTAGVVQVQRGSTLIGSPSAAPLPLNTYFYLEVKVTVHSSTGAFEVRKDGVAIIGPTTGQNTRGVGSNNSANAIRLGTSANALGNWRVGDVYINDGTGSIHNSFEGDCKVVPNYPTSAGDTTAWTPSAGSNFQCVDEATMNSDTDYVSSANVGDVDTYNVTDLPSNSGPPKVVQVGVFDRKDDAGPRSIALVARPGSTDNVGSDQAQSVSYAFHYQTWELNPDTAAAWTRAEFNASKFGHKLTV